MLYLSATVIAVLSGLSHAAPANWSTWSATPTAPPSPPTGHASAGAFTFPLSNGFPNPSSSALAAIQTQAHGTLPNGGAPKGLAADDLTSLQLIAFNEIFEVAFFTELLDNITSGVYSVDGTVAKSTLIDAITAVQAQEELHALNANGALVANGQEAIQPCKYDFPVDSLESAIALASTFTDVVLGTLQDVQLKLAQNNDDAVVPAIGSVIGQEGEQNGFYRSLQGKIPSALPFLTRSTREFAFSALQAFVVPGSCPNIDLIKLPIFTALNVLTQNIAPQDQILQFSVDAKAFGDKTPSLVYINQQNKPIVETPQNVKNANGLVTFEADLPFNANLMNGLTIAALTKSAGPFADAEAVAADTIAGPGLIEIN